MTISEFKRRHPEVAKSMEIGVISEDEYIRSWNRTIPRVAVYRISTHAAPPHPDQLTRNDGSLPPEPKAIATYRIGIGVSS